MMTQSDLARASAVARAVDLTTFGRETGRRRAAPAAELVGRRSECAAVDRLMPPEKVD